MSLVDRPAGTKAGIESVVPGLGVERDELDTTQVRQLWRDAPRGVHSGVSLIGRAQSGFLLETKKLFPQLREVSRRGQQLEEMKEAVAHRHDDAASCGAVYLGDESAAKRCQLTASADG
jgi:hypothetical protein